MGCCCCTPRCCYDYWSGCSIPTFKFKGLCGFPHGACYTIMAFVLAVGAVFMNAMVITSCFFQRVQQINPVTGEKIPGSERGYGFVSREADYGVQPDYQQCVYYPEEEVAIFFDSWVRAAKSMAFMSVVICAICLVVLTLSCCIAFSSSMFEYWLFWLYILAGICTALEFLMFGNEYCSENACRLADGGGQALSCVFFALCCANTVKSMANAMPPRYGNEDDDENSLWYDDEDDKYRPVELNESDEENDDDEASWESYYEEEEDDSDDESDEDDDVERNGGDDSDDGENSHESDQRYSSKKKPQGGNLGVGYDNDTGMDTVFDPISQSIAPMHSDTADESMYGKQPRVGDHDGPTIT